MAVPYVDGRIRLRRTDADPGAPCGGIVSSVRDMLKWQAMHLRQAAAACSASRTSDQRLIGLHCHPGNATPASGPTLLQDGTWAELLHANSNYPLLSLFGGYSLGLWVEPWGLGEVMMHHDGDLDGMASLQAMLPFLGHSM